MKTFIYIAVFIASTLLLNGCDRQSAIKPSGKEFKVGFIGPYTGPNGSQGRESVKGIKTVMQMQPLLPNGDAIELIEENDYDDPVLTEKALRKLVKEDMVSAIIIASSSLAVLRVAAIADKYETPIIALLATHAEITAQNSFVNQLCVEDTIQGTVAALFVMDELLIEKFAVFTEPDSAYSKYLGSVFANKVKSIGGEITGIITLDQGKTDYVAILEELRKKGTELLYLPIGIKQLIQIEQATEEMSWSPDMMGTDGMLANAIAQYPENIKQFDGFYATDFFAQSSKPPVTTFWKNVQSIYNTLYSGVGNSYVALGAEGYSILYHAMERCQNSADRECINRMIRSTQDISGVMAKISIRSDGKAIRPLYVNTIKNGKMKSMVVVY